MTTARTSRPFLVAPESRRVAVDLDGVLADFSSRAAEVLGRPFPEGAPSPEIAHAWMALARTEHFYRDLPLLPRALELWQGVVARGPGAYVLTAIPRRRTLPTAEADKRLWVERHLGREVEFRVGPFSRDKWRHARVGDVLIDDRQSNIHDWVTRGRGVGILHRDVDCSLGELDTVLGVGAEGRRW